MKCFSDKSAIKDGYWADTSAAYKCDTSCKTCTGTTKVGTDAT
jgi:hypothetical protein